MEDDVVDKYLAGAAEAMSDSIDKAISDSVDKKDVIVTMTLPSLLKRRYKYADLVTSGREGLTPPMYRLVSIAVDGDKFVIKGTTAQELYAYLIGEQEAPDDWERFKLWYAAKTINK